MIWQHGYIYKNNYSNFFNIYKDYKRGLHNKTFIIDNKKIKIIKISLYLKYIISYRPFALPTYHSPSINKVDKYEPFYSIY